MGKSKKLRLVMATNNAHKLHEARAICGGLVEVGALADIGCHDDIPETAPTLRGNARLKAQHVAQGYGVACFADDTGLMVDALGGEPGVMSARYAGPECDSRANVAKLLAAMEGVDDRRAHFATEVVVFDEDGREHCFTGRIDGTIAREPSGEGGFGYDPVFVPDEGGGLTFAQMGDQSKNAISHRGRALEAMMAWLKGYCKENNDI